MPCRGPCLAPHTVLPWYRLYCALPQFAEDKFSVLYKRPTDLNLLTDVPVCCNLLVANIFDEGGWLLNVWHAPAAHTGPAVVPLQPPPILHATVSHLIPCPPAHLPPFPPALPMQAC